MPAAMGSTDGGVTTRVVTPPSNFRLEMWRMRSLRGNRVVKHLKFAFPEQIDISGFLLG
jgi:hypothetical protein